MILDNKIDTISIEKAGTRIEFIPTGDIYQILKNDIMINQYLGNNIDGSLNNIYIRIYKNNGMKVIPLLGKDSKSRFYVSKEEAMWIGKTENIGYKVRFKLQEDEVYFYEISLDGNGEEVDIIYGQDISLAGKESTLTNELYISQYLEHKILKGNYGYVVSSKQNQEQDHKFPYIQQGSIDTEIIGYSTDAMQFFKKEYKKTNMPEILKGDLLNFNYQFEMAYIALQTKKIRVNGTKKITFYTVIKDNYSSAIEKINFHEELLKAHTNFLEDKEEKKYNEIEKVSIKRIFGEPFVSESMLEEELNRYYPNKKFEEYDNKELLSFFTDEHSHVVLREKELRVERPHGHIILTAIDEKNIDSETISSTNYMYGIFNAHIVVGNTNMHKFISAGRGLLNLFKNSGQRIYVKIEEVYRLLTLPSVYEMGINYSRWFYKIGDDMLSIISYCSANSTDVILEVNSEKGRAYEFIITQQLVMGNHEFQEKINLIQNEKGLMFLPSENSDIKNVYPKLNYKMKIVGTDYVVSDDRIFFESNVSYNNTLVTISTKTTNSFKMIISGSYENNTENFKEDISIGSFQENKNLYKNIYKEFMREFHLSLEGEKNKEIEKINEIFWWYTHNAIIHYKSPHGLEQTGGAAWGTRDVCQGPIEYFLATGHTDLAKETIKRIYSNQFYENGEWPQWFMYDKYNMRQYDSHGDVIFWPLKAIGDYIYKTGDKSILNLEIPYCNFKDGNKTEFKESILEHIKRSINSIKQRFIYDTKLISYAGGDWDDTLQPADEKLKESLVSSWTVALAYQVIKLLGETIVKVDPSYSEKLTQMSMEIKEAFEKYLIKDGVIAGFVEVHDKDNIDYILHPLDKKTNIQYRLLQMTRSIIGELVDKEQAEKNISIINNNLKFPDGVRLMNRPAYYKGGVSKIFKRAEQASNVGREIGLQYVHSHIRYIESMAKYGNANDAWNGLMMVNPINIREKVENALLRQSNCYFSSSDGDFNTRYEFQENFEKLRTSEIKVKGGWRIYSSGPGIYLNQIITNLLGIRMESNNLIIDPVIPEELDNLKLDFKLNNIYLTFIYHISSKRSKIKKITLNNEEIELYYIDNIYRTGGCLVDFKLLEGNYDKKNIIEVYM